MLTLVGMPGSGKSTVGRALARRLGRRFVDTDRLIESRIGCPIRDFFAAEGEDRFRGVESAVLAEVLGDGTPTVVATGGGIVLAEGNRRLLRDKSIVLYLRVPVEELCRRVANDTQRPLLQGSDPRERLRQLLADREPLYRAVAHFTLDDARPTVGRMVRKAIMQLELSGHLSGQTAP